MLLALSPTKFIFYLLDLASFTPTESCSSGLGRTSSMTCQLLSELEGASEYSHHLDIKSDQTINF